MPMPPSSRRQCTAARVRRFLRAFFGHLFSNLGLFALVVGYVLLGAFLFEWLESDFELEKRKHIRQYRDHCITELWRITESTTGSTFDQERLNVLYERNWTALVNNELRKFENSVVAAAKEHGYDGKDLSDSDLQWSFSGALLYSVTVITTIGYGNLAPKTAAGKVVTMMYALVGVPLMLLCLSNLGALLADTFKFAYAQAHACCTSCRSKPPPPPPPAPQQQPPPPPQPPPQPQPPALEVTPTPVAVTATLRRTPVRRVSAPLRPLGPEVRQLLTECAEYSVQQAGANPDPAATRLLRELRQQSQGTVAVLVEQRDCDKGDADGDADGDGDDQEDDDDEQEGDEDEEDDDDAEDHNSGAVHNTPSRVPLIWRPPSNHLPHHHHHYHHHHHHPTTQQPALKRPPTPPPRRSQPPDTTVESVPPSAEPGGAGAAVKQGSSNMVPVKLVLLVLAGYICLGAGIFATWEDWSFLDGAYFCFITLTTIGFGDLVPGKSLRKFQQGAAGDAKGQWLMVVACCVYLLLGLVLIAMSFSLVQAEVVARFRQVGKTLGLLKKR